MDVLRTPDGRFDGLPGWPYAPRYVEVQSDGGPPLRMHYVDESPAHPRERDPVLLLHGEPSWGFLYRTMMESLLDLGHRVVVPDLVGFGRSDKPASRDDYTYQRHVDWTRALIEQLDLRWVTLFCQDWGGLIGLRLVGEQPDRFARVVAANTFLPTGDQPLGDGFEAWRRFSQEVPELPVGRILDGGSARDLEPEVVAAYEAPYPDESFKAGARAFPALVPASPDDPAAPANRRAWETLREFDRPFLTAFSDGDPITRGADAVLQSLIPGAAGRDHRTVPGGHFLQEDSGPALARIIDELIATT